MKVKEQLRFMPSYYEKLRHLCLCRIEGDPITWARPAGTFRRYDTQKDIKRQIAWQVKKEMIGKKPSKFPLLVELIFCIYSPKSINKRTKYPIFKKDIDNLQKLILDSCNAITWDDDGQIIDVHARKVWADSKQTAQTILAVWEILE